VHGTTETEVTATYDLQVLSESRQIRLLAFWCPSVRPSTCINEASTGDFTWNLILDSLIKIYREIPDWLQSTINQAMYMKT